MTATASPRGRAWGPSQPARRSIAYRRRTGGDVLVVLIHGNTVHFDALAGALAGRYAVHAPDLRGFGASTYERRIDSVDDLVGDAARLDRRRRRLDVSPPGGVVGGRGRRRPVRRRV